MDKAGSHMAVILVAVQIRRFCPETEEMMVIIILFWLYLVAVFLVVAVVMDLVVASPMSAWHMFFHRVDHTIDLAVKIGHTFQVTQRLVHT